MLDTVVRVGDGCGQVGALVFGDLAVDERLFELVRHVVQSMLQVTATRCYGAVQQVLAGVLPRIVFSSHSGADDVRAQEVILSEP